MSGDEGDTTAAGPVPAPPPRRDRGGEPPVLPDVSRDEQELGWGDEPSRRDDDWYRRERPPHHG
ncbi:hypothetical protein [uncultured Jatrophihabitans sp.]|uniref:hypothetical protein n=1 Tax=uncultured Jatrophihabitans sp. TaxID=1610747 RepID=UPI0035CAFE2C